MFAYIEQDSYLHKRNPMMKLFIILVWTFVVSMSYFPVLPIMVFLIAFLGTWILGNSIWKSSWKSDGCCCG